jgi:precorrin-2/cobalt-factor-2 C20-methyltransferase
MTKKATLYGIGVGPGDPGLLTVKAVDVLQDVGVVFAASSPKNNYSRALNVVKDILVPSVSVRNLAFPMTKDKEELEASWQKNAKEVIACLKGGDDAAFLTLGDPLTYSTYGYLINYIKKLAPDTNIVTIPGISAHNAASARLNIPLVEGKESLLVVSGVEELDRIKELCRTADNLVILKPYRRFEEILAILKETKPLASPVLISHLGQEDERIEMEPALLKGQKIPYLSLLIVKNDSYSNRLENLREMGLAALSQSKVEEELDNIDNIDRPLKQVVC